MNNQDFNTAVERQVEKSLDVLIAKGVGYGEEDRLAHFKRAAGLLGETQEQALMGMAVKHFVSLAQLAARPAGSVPLNIWDEKIGDAINYLLILSAMIREEK